MMTEKKRVEEELDRKNFENIKVLGELRSELETLQLKFGEIDYENKNLKKQNDWFEESLSEKNVEIEKLGEEIMKVEDNRKELMTVIKT